MECRGGASTLLYWTGENGGGHGFREFVILYALCHKSSLLEWLRSIEWILNLFNVQFFFRFNIKLILQCTIAEKERRKFSIHYSISNFLHEWDGVKRNTFIHSKNYMLMPQEECEQEFTRRNLENTHTNAHWAALAQGEGQVICCD